MNISLASYTDVKGDNPPPKKTETKKNQKPNNLNKSNQPNKPKQSKKLQQNNNKIKPNKVLKHYDRDK